MISCVEVQPWDEGRSDNDSTHINLTPSQVGFNTWHITLCCVMCWSHTLNYSKRVKKKYRETYNVLILHQTPVFRCFSFWAHGWTSSPGCRTWVWMELPIGWGRTRTWVWRLIRVGGLPIRITRWWWWWWWWWRWWWTVTRSTVSSHHVVYLLLLKPRLRLNCDLMCALYPHLLPYNDVGVGEGNVWTICPLTTNPTVNWDGV